MIPEYSAKIPTWKSPGPSFFEKPSNIPGSPKALHIVHTGIVLFEIGHHFPPQRKPGMSSMSSEETVENQLVLVAT